MPPASEPTNSMRCARSKFDRAFTLGQIADDTGEDALAVDRRFADRQIERKDAAVFCPNGFATDADDLAIAGLEVAAKIFVVLRSIGRRHQD